MKKKILALFLALMIMTGAFVPSAVHMHAEGNGAVKLTTPLFYAEHGHQFTVSVNLETNPGMSGFDFGVTFDPAAVRLTGYTDGGLFTGVTYSPSQTDAEGTYYSSPFKFNWYHNNQEPNTATGKIVDLTFKMLNLPASSVEIEFFKSSFLDMDLQEIEVDITNLDVLIGHNSDGTPTNDDVDATCGTDGKDWWACSVCGLEYYEVIPATGVHTPAYEYIFGTHTHKKYCSVCNTVLTASEDCTLIDDPDKEDVPATCVDGHNYSICQYCGRKYEDTLDPISDHTYAYEHIDGTETHKKYCSVCNTVFNASEDCNKDYTLGGVDEPATCVDPGKDYWKCTICGHEGHDIIPATGHNYVPTILDSSDFDYEYKHDMRCGCGASSGRVNHDPLVVDDEKSVAATCTSQGKTVYKPCVCGYQEPHVTLAMLPHDFDGQPLIRDQEPTHIADGSGHYECKVCGAHSDPVNIPMPEGGHDFSKAISNGDGTHKMVCSIAGCTVEDTNNTAVPCSKEVDTANSTAPKCNEDGVWKYLPCTCGYVFDSETNPNRPPHSYGDWYELNSVSHERECAVCGDKQQQDHDFDGQPLIRDQEPTHIADGSGHYECKVCGADSGPVPIDMIGDHDFSMAVSNGDGTHKMVCGITGCTAEDPNKTAVPCAKIIDTVNSTEPSCNADGKWVYLPCVCGYQFPDETRSATGAHNFVATILDATDPDYETMHDMRCGCGASNGKKPHTFGAYQWIIYPTEFIDGLKVRTCTACGFADNLTVPAGAVPATITFRTNGGTAVKAYEGYTSEIIDLTQYKPFKRGSYFAGWFTDPALTIPADIMFVLEGDVILYAKYGALSGSVTYFPFPILPVNPNFSNLYFQTNGGLAIDPITLSTGTTINLWQYIPVRPGYSFEGWYRDAELTRRITQVQVIDPNTVVYAKWSLIG